MSQRIRDIGLTVCVLAAVAVGASAVAGANDDGSGSSSGSSSGTSGVATQAQARPDPSQAHHPGEELLTGDTAAKVKKAAQDKVPGATVLRVETDTEGDKYEAHMRKSDGSEVTVKVNADFEATEVEEGHGGPGGRGGPPPDAGGDGSGSTQPNSFVQ